MHISMQSRAILLVALVEALGAGSRPIAEAQPPLRSPRVELIKELAVGQVDGPPEYAFGRIQALAATRAGSFFVFDASDTQIRRYNAQGVFLGKVGRSGAGPGEYRYASAMATHGDSLLLVYDPSNARISIFDTSGTYRQQLSFSRFTLSGDKAVVLDRSGRLAVRMSKSGGLVEGPDFQSQYLWMRLDGTVLDSVSLPSPAIEGGMGYVLMTSDGPRYNFPIETVFALLPDRSLVSGRTSAYKISIAPPNGPSVLVERAVPPIRIAGAERDEWEAWNRYFSSRPQSPPPRPLPQNKPYFRDLLADDIGRLWVHRYSEATKRSIPPRPAGDARPLLTIRERNTYDVFSPRGKELGTVELAPHTILIAIRGDRIYVRREAEGGEYILERYALKGLASP